MLQVKERHVNNSEPVTCTCDKCHEVFTVYAKIKGGRIEKLENHPHLIQGNGIKTYHRCGGYLTFFL